MPPRLITACRPRRLAFLALRPAGRVGRPEEVADACPKLRQYCIEGTKLDRGQIGSYLSRSFMLVTALSPEIGYDKASAIAHKANDEGTTLRQAALATGYISADDFDRIVNPAAMAGLRRGSHD